jgi:hypothetical protein
MSYNGSIANSIYMFRCNDGGLYAFTGDRTGQILPSHIYPRITWRLVRCVTLQRHQSQAKKKMFTATLDAVKKHGFYLTHAGTKEVDALLEGIERGR